MYMDQYPPTMSEDYALRHVQDKFAHMKNQMYIAETEEKQC
jgi:hypothetical protein